MPKIKLETPVSELTRVGKTAAVRLQKLGIRTVADLLRHYPFRYDDFGLVLPIAKLRPGSIATVRGRLELIENRRSPRRRLLLTEALISDASGSISAVWFNQPYLARMFRPGDEVYVAGQVNYEFHQLQFSNPSLEPVKAFTLHTARLVPIYPTTTGLTQRQLRFLVQQALHVAPMMEEVLPPELRRRLQLPVLSWALQQIHFPGNHKHLHAALRRLKFDELFLLQLVLQTARLQLRHHAALPIAFHVEQTKQFVNHLGFQLTEDQRKAAWKILQDIEKPAPMNRLLEGEVGSGKTVVVAIAALNVALSGGQTAVMAPTEILAEQHWKTFCRIFSGTEISMALFTSSRRAVQLQPTGTTVGGKLEEKVKKPQLLKHLRDGAIDVIVGTHALLQEGVLWKRLALAVVDEQHRFGVEQRQRLLSAANDHSPHLLTLTATPIPRSLALVLYGDLAISAIRQLPLERKPIRTQIITPESRPRLYQFIRGQISAGRQAFVVCPLIDPSDALGVRAATVEREKLQAEVFADLKVEVLHGKLSADKKAAVMADYLTGTIHILVSTTVVEVGVDIPNASVMVIEGAERFGLSQLHQLRGRVGRSVHQSFCFLCTDAVGGPAHERLSAFLRAKDGFELSELDLQFRGPGEIIGTDQSGFSQLRLATLSDLALAQTARDEATRLLAEDSTLARYPQLAALAHQHQDTGIHLE